MRTPTSAARCLGGVALTVACAPKPTPATPPPAAAANADVDERVGPPKRAAANAFARVEGGAFTVGGAPHRVVGTNFWAAMNLGSAGPGGDRARLVRELDALAELGVNNLRIMAASEGPDGVPNRVAPAMITAPGEYNDALLEGLDFTLDACSARGVRVVMVLSNFWEWSGGMPQYVSWAEGTPIAHAWEVPFKTYTDYASRFYTCAKCQAWYRAHIETLITRRNTINGRLYRDDPTIFAWELANEPRLYPDAWIDETAAYIHALDPNHMVTTGSEGEIGGDFEATHDGPRVDYATAHIWPQNWGWYDPRAPETLPRALETAVEYLERHRELGERLGKPVVLEEFGLGRDHGAGLDPFDPATPTTRRDQLYDALFTAVERSARAGGALQGTAFWAWAGEGRPPDPWIGDPPHEPGGWYSVYDRDASTLARVRAHASSLRAGEREPAAATRSP